VSGRRALRTYSAPKRPKSIGSAMRSALVKSCRKATSCHPPTRAATSLRTPWRFKSSPAHNGKSSRRHQNRHKNDLSTAQERGLSAPSSRSPIRELDLAERVEP
jgi:hypothetical protein